MNTLDPFLAYQMRNIVTDALNDFFVTPPKPPMSDEELGFVAWEAIKHSLWPNSFTPNLGAVGAAIRAKLAGK